VLYILAKWNKSEIKMISFPKLWSIWVCDLK
jgi:hypothetical protein